MDETLLGLLKNYTRLFDYSNQQFVYFTFVLASTLLLVSTLGHLEASAASSNSVYLKRKLISQLEVSLGRKIDYDFLF